MKFVATINVPGYSPMDDEPAEFDTAFDAWEYLADERERAEDDAPGESYSATCGELRERARNAPSIRSIASSDGTGTVYGDTPGYDGNHDQGLAYSVSVAIACEHDQTREKVTCGACGRSWCDRCTGTHGPRCAFEYDHPTGIND